MKFPNSEFYNGNLKSDSSVNDINLDEIIDLKELTHLKENDVENNKDNIHLLVSLILTIS